MSNLTDSIDNLFVDGVSEGTSNASLRSAFLQLATSSPANNDTVSGTIASIDIFATTEGDSANVTDFPPGGTAGTFSVMSVRQADQAVTYLLTDFNNELHVGSRPLAGSITWQSLKSKTTVAYPTEGELIIDNDDADINTMVFSDTISANIEDGDSYIVTFIYEEGLTPGNFDNSGIVYYKDSGSAYRFFEDVTGTRISVTEFKTIALNRATIKIWYNSSRNSMVLIEVIQNSSTSAVPVGVLLANGTIGLDQAFTPSGPRDLVPLEYMEDALVGTTVPAGYPRGFVNATYTSGVDAVSNPVTTVVTMTGSPSRIYKAEAKVYFSYNEEINGEISGSFITRTSGGAQQLAYPFSTGTLDVQLSSNSRAFHCYQWFNKSDAGQLDFTFQLKGTWNSPLDTIVDVIVEDRGEGAAPLPIGSSLVPQILSSNITADQVTEIDAISDINLTSTDFSGISVANHTLIARNFNGTTMTLTVSDAFTGGESVTWSYNNAAAGSDLRSDLNDVELLTGTFNVVNNIGGVESFFSIGTLIDFTGTGAVTNGTNSPGTVIVDGSYLEYTAGYEMPCRYHERVDHQNSTDYGYGVLGIEYIA